MSLRFFSVSLFYCFFTQGGRQLLRQLVYLAGYSLDRTLVCLTCLYCLLTSALMPSCQTLMEPQGRSVG